jgi:hypothetical protein
VLLGFLGVCCGKARFLPDETWDKLARAKEKAGGSLQKIPVLPSSQIASHLVNLAG